MRLCSEKSRRWKRILRVDDVEVGDFKTANWARDNTPSDRVLRRL